MKNVIIIVLFFALGTAVFYYEYMDGSVGGSNDDEVIPEEVDELREKLEEFKKSSTVGEKKEPAAESDKDNEEEDDDADSDDSDEDADAEEEVEEVVKASVEKEKENFITLTSPDGKETVSSLPIVFTGKLSEGATKLVVTAEGGEGSDSYTDVYTLQDFKKGDTTFTYRAKPAWDNLAPGLNEYEFKAYFENGETESAFISVSYEEN